MNLPACFRTLRIASAIFTATISCVPAYSASAPGIEPGVVELGSAEISSTAKLPAVAGGDVRISIRVTLRTSPEVVKEANDGIASGRFRPPFMDNKDFLDLVLRSRPGSFDLEVLELNKESRFYYFIESQLKTLTREPSIPAELSRKTNDVIQRTKRLIYQTIRPNDFAGAKILFQQGPDKGSVLFLGSTKRGNKQIGKLDFTAQEQPILDAMKRLLTENKPGSGCVSMSEKGSLDDIIRSAQEKKIITTKG